MIEEKVYLSIGSNIGDRESNIASSIAMLGSYIEISYIRSSSFFETDPQYYENQPAFLNLVLEIETILTPFQLLDKISEIEKMLGRDKKREKNQPPARLRVLTMRARTARHVLRGSRARTQLRGSEC